MCMATDTATVSSGRVSVLGSPNPIPDTRTTASRTRIATSA